jgi:dihydrolipoamide dehydrogenase
MKKYDIAIIGSGPAGYVAAIRSAQLGLKTVIVEEKNLGGVCLNVGCIPTKSLLHAAKVYHTIQKAEVYGIKAEKVSFDFNAIITKSKSTVSSITHNLGNLIKNNKIDIVQGKGYIKDPGTLIVKDMKEEIKASNIIIATGASPKKLDWMGKEVWTYKEAINPPKQPKSMIIVGSGAIGMEFASFYSTFGTEVTVLEAQQNILPSEDQEISEIAHKIFTKKGIKIHTGVKLDKNSLKKLTENSVEIQIDKKENIKAEKILIAIGVVPRINDIGLENLGVKIEKGYIATNESMETNVKGIYAIGDVTKDPWLAHKASHEAVKCVEKIANFSKSHAYHDQMIPACVFTIPQIASIGYTEQQALSLGLEIKVGRFPLIANGNAFSSGNTEGMVKVIFDKNTGELLGAHLIGEGVSELIGVYSLTKTMEGTDLDLMNTIFPHPTLSEIIHESALQSDGKPIHI